MESENTFDENSAPVDSFENENTQVSSEKQINRTLRDPNRFPTTRIRAIMRMDPDLTIASQESVYLISKAAELFVQYQAQEAYKKTVASKRKTVQKRDLDAAIVECDGMAFLEGAID